MPTYKIHYRWTKDGEEKGRHVRSFRETSDKRARGWARNFIDGLQKANSMHDLKYSPLRFVKIKIIQEELPLWNDKEQP